MAAFNKVVLVGNLTRDPELRYTPSGTAVADLRLAVTTKRKNGDETLYIDATVWERQAETCCEYLAKGSSVLVEGRLKMEEWNDRESGQKRTKIGIAVQQVQFLSRAERRGQVPQDRPQDGAASQRAEPVKQDDVPF